MIMRTVQPACTHRAVSSGQAGAGGLTGRGVGRAGLAEVEQPAKQGVQKATEAVARTASAWVAEQLSDCQAQAGFVAAAGGLAADRVGAGVEGAGILVGANTAPASFARARDGHDAVRIKVKTKTKKSEIIKCRRPGAGRAGDTGCATNQRQPSCQVLVDRHGTALLFALQRGDHLC